MVGTAVRKLNQSKKPLQFMNNKPSWIDWRVDILQDLIAADSRYHNLTIDEIIERLKKFNHLSPIEVGENFEEEELRDRLEKSNGVKETKMMVDKLPKPIKEYIDHLFFSTNGAIAKAIGVKYLMVGNLKVKDDSTLIYKGMTLPVLGYYMKWPETGSHSDGWDEYLVSLLGMGFEWDETTISTGDIEWIDAKPIE